MRHGLSAAMRMNWPRTSPWWLASQAQSRGQFYKQDPWSSIQTFMKNRGSTKPLWSFLRLILFAFFSTLFSLKAPMLGFARPSDSNNTSIISSGNQSPLRGFGAKSLMLQNTSGHQSARDRVSLDPDVGGSEETGPLGNRYNIPLRKEDWVSHTR